MFYIYIHIYTYINGILQLLLLSRQKKTSFKGRQIFEGHGIFFPESFIQRDVNKREKLLYLV